MPDIVFGDDDRAVFTTKHHGSVSLSKQRWSIICGQPERFYYRENVEKVAATLKNPDAIRFHQQNKSQLIYYKRFTSLMLNESVHEVKNGVYFAVIIDTGTSRICTVYPVEQQKPGKLFVPPRRV